MVQTVQFAAFLCMVFGFNCFAGHALSPSALVVVKDGTSVFIACGTDGRVLSLDTASQKVLSSIKPLESPSSLTLSPDEKWLYVTCASPESRVCIVDLVKHKTVATLSAGHTAMAPVVSKDGRTLYVCNRFNNNVSVFDLEKRVETGRIPVRREPVAADLTLDGKYLLVANHLPAGRADVENVSAVISVIDLQTKRVTQELSLPSGSGMLKDLRVSPGGNYAAVTHIFASFLRAANRVDKGWMNANALTVIDLKTMRPLQTILLDTPQRGAANPWGIAWSADGKTLIITHAGTHEVSLIDFPKLVAGLPEMSKVRSADKTNSACLTYVSHYEGLDKGLPFLTGARQRIQLPAGDLGPRSVTVAGNKAYAGNYFSDTISVIDLNHSQTVQSIALGPKTTMNTIRKGELYFHDATLCREGWQSCASCHPGARADGLNWDLMNDGIGNPKNTKSLLAAHKTAPVMFLGVRTNAETAVRSGIKYILMTKQPEEIAVAMDEYLKSLKPEPSPYLQNGKLSPTAKRGKKTFKKLGCTECHVPKLYTDHKPHDVGTRRTFDDPGDKFYTPTLIEAWRTAPYLHDGSAVTIRDVLTTRNPKGEHGKVSGVSEQELNDLCEYVLSL